MPTARSTDPHTSHAAARSLTPEGITAQQTLVLVALLGWPLHDEVIAQHSGLRLASAVKRRGELVEKGYVEDAGFTARTTSGRRSIVWRLTRTGYLAASEAERLIRRRGG